MIHLFDTELLKKDYVFLSLSKIHGLNQKTSKKICKTLGISGNLKVSSLTKKHTFNFIKLFESTNLLLGATLKRRQLTILKRQIKIKTKKGLRKRKGLPVRGQRTHTNARSAKSGFATSYRV